MREEVLKAEQVRETVEVAVTPVSPPLPLYSVSLNKDVPEEHASVIREDASVEPSSNLATLRSHDESEDNSSNSFDHEPLEDVSMEVQVEVKNDAQMNHLCEESSSGT